MSQPGESPCHVVQFLCLEPVHPRYRIFGNHLQRLVDQFLISLGIVGRHVNVIVVRVGAASFVVTESHGGERPYTIRNFLRLVRIHPLDQIPRHPPQDANDAIVLLPRDLRRSRDDAADVVAFRMQRRQRPGGIGELLGLELQSEESTAAVVERVGDKFDEFHLGLTAYAGGGECPYGIAQFLRFGTLSPSLLQFEFGRAH
mmetsp:Transcript_34358/g.72305  ORF Transcript_34358/g.72305 Transcript_34358/m.72305 type:complete len:201 (+) Transcript_34358:1975-2577(+)